LFYTFGVQFLIESLGKPNPQLLKAAKRCGQAMPKMTQKLKH
jgi:hypothetical protein